MLSKCANPDCEARFRYLKEGTVYIAEWPNEGDSCELTESAGPLHHRWERREMFWLCSDCNRSMILISKGKEVVAMPRAKVPAKDDRVLRVLKIAV